MSKIIGWAVPGEMYCVDCVNAGDADSSFYMPTKIKLSPLGLSRVTGFTADKVYDVLVNDENGEIHVANDLGYPFSLLINEYYTVEVNRSEVIDLDDSDLCDNLEIHPVFDTDEYDEEQGESCGCCLQYLEGRERKEYWVDTWFERDRASVTLYFGENRNTALSRTIKAWWDEEVHEFVEDGLLKPSDWLGSAVEYCKSVGLIS
jgi:hypothetical protein